MTEETTDAVPEAAEPHSPARLQHFSGFDLVYCGLIFWPAILLFRLGGVSVIEWLPHPLADETMALAITLSRIAGYVLTAWLVMRWIVAKRDGGAQAIGLSLPVSPSAWAWAFGTYIVGISAWVGFVYFAAAKLAAQPGLSFSFLANPASWTSQSWHILLLTVVVAPVVEEIVFRGVGMAGFCNSFTPGLAMLFTTLLFTLSHGGLTFSIFLVGILLSAIRLKTGSLYCCMAVHAFHNLIVIAVIGRLFPAP